MLESYGVISLKTGVTRFSFTLFNLTFCSSAIVPSLPITLFVLHRTAATRGVDPSPVVLGFDPAHRALLHLGAIQHRQGEHALLLQAGEPRLHRRVVVAVDDPAHRQGVAHQLCGLEPRERPADDAVRCRVHDRGQVQGTFRGLQMVRVGDPQPIGIGRAEAVPHVIDKKSMAWNRAGPAPARCLRGQSHLVHQPLHASLAHLHAIKSQCQQHPALGVDGARARLVLASQLRDLDAIPCLDQYV